MGRDCGTRDGMFQVARRGVARAAHVQYAPVPMPPSGFSYVFRDPELLALARTHASTGAARDNERMEFLGDAVLDLVVAEELFRRMLELLEGSMMQRKASVVSRKSLAKA